MNETLKKSPAKAVALVSAALALPACYDNTSIKEAQSTIRRAHELQALIDAGTCDAAFECNNHHLQDGEKPITKGLYPYDSWQNTFEITCGDLVFHVRDGRGKPVYAGKEREHFVSFREQKPSGTGMWVVANYAEGPNDDFRRAIRVDQEMTKWMCRPEGDGAYCGSYELGSKSISLSQFNGLVEALSNAVHRIMNGVRPYAKAVNCGPTKVPQSHDE